MLGWMHKRNGRHWLRLKLLAFAVLSAAVVAGPAAAKYDNAAAGKASTSVEIPYLSHGNGVSEPAGEVAGGVTPTNLARVYVPRYLGVAAPDGVQAPQLAVDERALVRDVPDGLGSEIRSSGGETVSVTHDPRSFELGDAALGFGLGLLLAMAGVLTLALTRRNMRMAHQ